MLDSTTGSSGCFSPGTNVLWPTLAALGRAGQVTEAIDHLRAAVSANPFDSAAARALFQALTESGAHTAQRELVEQRQELAAAVPLLLREGWFAVEQAAAEPPAEDNGSGWLQTLTREEFRSRFGTQDTDRAVCGFTNPTDTNVVLTLLDHVRPRRILEIGTPLGQMTANFTEWSKDSVIFPWAASPTCRDGTPGSRAISSARFLPPSLLPLGHSPPQRRLDQS
jgi:hypothetical protein